MTTPEPPHRKSRSFQWVTSSVYLLAVAAAGAGVLLALATSRLDALVGAPRAPWPRLPVANARTLLGGVVGGTVTAAAVLFWVRGMLVQLASGEFSPRVLRWYLEDAFERATMAGLVGLFTFLATALLMLPSDGAALAPPVSLLVAFAAATAILLLIIASIVNSVESTQASRILHGIADRTLMTIRSVHPERGHTPAASRRNPAHDGTRAVATPVLAEDDGWVRDVHPERILRALPPHTVVELHACVGGFVTRGDVLARISLDGGDAAGTVADAARSAVVLGTSRAVATDVAMGVEELVNVALRVFAPGSGEQTTAVETVRRLEGLVRQILVRDLPPDQWSGEDGRRVVRVTGFTHGDYVALAFDEIRRAGARFTVISVALLDALGRLARDVREAGLPEREPAVREQAERVLAEARAVDMIAADRERIAAAARVNGFA